MDNSVSIQLISKQFLCTHVVGDFVACIELQNSYMITRVDADFVPCVISHDNFNMSTRVVWNFHPSTILQSIFTMICNVDGDFAPYFLLQNNIFGVRMWMVILWHMFHYKTIFVHGCGR